MEIKFNLYEPKLTKWLSMNKVVYLFGLPTFIIFIVLQTTISIPESVNSIVVPIIFLTFYVIPVVWGIINYGKIIKQNKLLKGQLVFSENCLSIKGEKINISEIAKLEFKLHSYYSEMSGGFNFGPNRKNGTENWLIITFKDGDFLKLQFQRMYEHQLRSIKPFLINMYKNNKINLIHTTELLGIDGYEDIKEFKEEIKPSSTIPKT